MRDAIRPALLLCAFGLCTLAIAQAPPSEPANQPVTPPVSAAVAPLNGSVRLLAVDRDGHPVTDLKPEELIVRVKKEQRRILSVFRAGDSPKGIGVFFDVSGSRAKDKLLAQEIQSSAKFLEVVWRPGDLGFVVAFNNLPHTQMEPTHDLKRVQDALEKMPEPSYSSTALYDALCSVRVSGKQNGIGEKVFLVVSDFEDNASHRTEQEIEKMQSEGVRVFPLLLRVGSEKPHELRETKRAAEKPAEKTGGDILSVEKEKDLSPAFVRLANELQGAYELTYETIPTSGKETKVQVETTRKNVRLFFAKY